MATIKKYLIVLLGVLCASILRTQPALAANEAELNGDYAFTFNGMTTGGNGASTAFAAVGRFTSDGAGNLVNGELDTNGVGLSEKLIAQRFTGTYSIGADHRGLMSLNIPGGGELAFAMMANGNAKFIEIDASGGNGTVGSGTIERVDTSAYATARIVGDYAFGLVGFDPSNNRVAVAGRFTANGSGAFGNGAADVNQSGIFTTWNGFAATYVVTDTTSGRGMIVLPPLLGGVPTNLNFFFYIVNGGELFAMESDVPTTLTPLLNGAFLRQQTPSGGFSSNSLSASMVIYMTGRSSSCGAGVATAPNVLAGLLSPAGNGSLSLTYDENCGGIPSSAIGLPGTYSVTADGRSAIRVGTSYVVGYLLDSNQAFLIAPDNSVLFGFSEPQAIGPLSNSSMNGTFAGSSIGAATLDVTRFSGEFTADGSSPTGNIVGVEDMGAPSGPTLAIAANATYSVSSTPTNGRGSITGNFIKNGIIYLISATKYVAISLGDPHPAILLFEK